MKKEKKPFILPALGMMAVLLIAVTLFFRFSRADNTEAGLSTEEAKYIALHDAGEQLNQVTFTRANLDQDSGIPVYQIDFYTENKNYEYEISAQTGNIRDKEITVLQKESSTGSRQNTGTTPAKSQKETTEVIGVKKAQSIALAAANLKEKQVTFTKTNLETEDGIPVYEIEFTKDTQKYEYDVDAYTGEILSYDIDRKEQLPAKSTEKKPSSQGSKGSIQDSDDDDDDPDEDDDGDDDDDRDENDDDADDSDEDDD